MISKIFVKFFSALYP